MPEFEQFDKFPAPGVHPAPTYSQLVGRVEKLEEIVTKLIGHQHQVNRPERYGPVTSDTTRPVGMSGTKL
jgi:hypothetical protein